MKNNLRKRIYQILSCILCVAFVYSMLPAAYAEAKTNVTLDVTDGSITITSSGYTIGNDVLNSYTGDYTIIQTDSSTSNTIKVSDGVCNITLSGINISTTTTSPFSVENNAEVILTLVGDNVLDASSVESYAGLEVPSGATITIQGDGNLTATGGSYGAGIGGSQNYDGGNITINEGTITATGGASGSNSGTGAGIGGGGTEPTGDAGSGGVITINGGVITATGGKVEGMAIGTGAGIGGGGSKSGTAGSGGSIIINSGTVIASGGGTSASWWAGTGAGIGGGGTESGTAGAGGEVTITDGTVIATGGSSSNTHSGTGAGIGGGGSRGDQVQSSGGAGGMLTVTGGTVTATGGAASNSHSGTGAGIGGGGVGQQNNSAIAGAGGTVIITGGIVTASGGNESYEAVSDDDLGGGYSDDDLRGGVIQDVQYSGAGIGSGRKYGDNLSVSGKVTIAVYMKYGTSASSTINTFTYGTGIEIDSFDSSQYVIVQPILIMNSSPKDVSAAYGNTVELSAEAITAEKDSVITYQCLSFREM